MRLVLLFAIKCYWILIPKSKRNHCIFSESCSNYVFRITKDKGLFKGLISFKERFNSCRPGFHIVQLKGETYLITVNQKLFKQEEICSKIISN